MCCIVLQAAAAASSQQWLSSLGALLSQVEGERDGLRRELSRYVRVTVAPNSGACGCVIGNQAVEVSAVWSNGVEGATGRAAAGTQPLRARHGAAQLGRGVVVTRIWPSAASGDGRHCAAMRAERTWLPRAFSFCACLPCA